MKKNYIHSLNQKLAIEPSLWANYQSIVLLACQAPKFLSGILITADNPLGEKVSPRANRNFRLQLRQMMVQQRCDYQLVWGASPDQSHAELTFYLPFTLSQGRRLARRFHQLGFYSCHQGQLILHQSLSGQYPDVWLGALSDYWQCSWNSFRQLQRRF